MKIGRGMRLSPGTGKTDCHIIDFVDSYSRVSGIMSVPTLFGLDMEEKIEGLLCMPVCKVFAILISVIDETILSLHERGMADHPLGFSSNPVPEPTAVTYIDYDNPFVSYIYLI